MKRYAAIAFIVLYLALLGYGLAAHVLVYNNVAHPGMYFIVWDMYCGWSAYECRVHIVAEGESGNLYELESPWGSFHPFGSIDRRHYDNNVVHCGHIGRNILAHTEHEPMERIFVIEESWSKKYNLSPELWSQFHDEPFEPVSYFRPRAWFSVDGVCQERYLDIGSYLAHQAVASNPRLRNAMARGRPYFAIDPQASRFGGVVPASGTSARE